MRDNTTPSASWVMTLLALQRKPNIYAGTVPDNEIRRRRRRNKQARLSRRRNRK
jgi:hypothetical protein